MITGDPLEGTALAVGCPVPRCRARVGDRCITEYVRAYHVPRAMAGVKVEFPNVGGDAR